MTASERDEGPTASQDAGPAGRPPTWRSVGVTPSDRLRVLAPAVAFFLTTSTTCVDAYLLREPPAPASQPTNAWPTLGEVALASETVAPKAAKSAAVIEGPAVRVRVSGGLPSGRVRFSVNGPYRIYLGANADTGDAERLVAQGHRLGSGLAGINQGAIEVNGVRLGGLVATVRPQTRGTLLIGDRAYYGALVLDGTSGSIQAVNLVEIEDYVAGVLHAEMPARFAVEARRAQAAISRTYALYHSLQGSVLRDDQGSQVYRGMEKDDADARRIVESTRGEILTWKGVPFETFFHSTCGGATSSAALVFGTKTVEPLERGVGCPYCRHSPYYEWSRDIELARLRDLYPSARRPRLALGERDESGRAMELLVFDEGDKPVDRASASRLRRFYNRTLPLKRQLPSALWIDVSTTGGDQRVTGRGFGHGVGLCQYGADGLGDRGASYRDILRHYYPGSEIARLPE